MIHQRQFEVETSGRASYDISSDVQRIVRESEADIGLCHVFIRHTSASLMVSENADPAVLEDLESFMSRLVPDGDALYTHTAEGPDDMPSHVRSILTQTDLSLPVSHGQCALGTWQGIYLWEHRHAPHTRQVLVTVHGEKA